MFELLLLTSKESVILLITSFTVKFTELPWILLLFYFAVVAAAVVVVVVVIKVIGRKISQKFQINLIQKIKRYVDYIFVFFKKPENMLVKKHKNIKLSIDTIINGFDTIINGSFYFLNIKIRKALYKRFCGYQGIPLI